MAAPAWHVLTAEATALPVLACCAVPDLQRLQLVSRSVRQAVQQQSQRILRLLYNMPFPAPSRHHTTNALQLIARCEAATSVFRRLTELTDEPPGAVYTEGLVVGEERLASTELGRAGTCLSCAKPHAAALDTQPFVPLVLCRDPRPLPEAEDVRLRCYDDFATEVTDDTGRAVPAALVCRSGLALYVAERHEWDTSIPPDPSPAASSSPGPGPRLYLHQAQRPPFEVALPPVPLPFPAVRRLIDAGEGAAAVAGERETLVLAGTLAPHPVLAARRQGGRGERPERLPPVWTLCTAHCGLIPGSASDALQLPNGNVLALIGPAVQLWAPPPASPTATAAPWNRFVLQTTTPLPFLSPPPTLPASATAPPSEAEAEAEAANSPPPLEGPPPPPSPADPTPSPTPRRPVRRAALPEPEKAAAPAEMPGPSVTRSTRSRPGHAASLPTPALEAEPLPQFVAADVVVGVVGAVGAKGRRLVCWRVGEAEVHTVGVATASEQFHVLRPVDSEFFAFTVSPADSPRPATCTVVDLATLAVQRTLALGPWGAPTAFGPNLLCTAQPDRVRLFDGKQEVTVPTPWRDNGGRAGDSIIVPLSGGSLLVAEVPRPGLRAVHFVLLDPAKAKARRLLLSQLPASPPTLRPWADFYAFKPPPAEPPKGAGGTATLRSPSPRGPSPAAVLPSPGAEKRKVPPASPTRPAAKRRQSGGAAHRKSEPEPETEGWTPAEDAALRAGVAALGEGRWIELGNTYPALARRPSAVLRARWVDLQSGGA